MMDSVFKYVTGIVILRGATDNTRIGNTGDSLKVLVTASALPSGAATETTLASILTSVQIMDDWDESDRAKVNPIVGQAGLQGGSGLVSANTLRMVLATDVPLPTGTNSIGQVTANAGTNLNTSLLALESGGNLASCATSLAIIDDWDESDRAKVNPIVGQAGVQGDNGVVTANTQRVVLATNVALPAGTNTLGAVTQTVRGTQAAAFTDATAQIPSISNYGMPLVQQQPATLAEWGKMFMATTNFVSTGTTAQAALMLFRNPNGSGVNVRIRSMTFYGAGGTFRIYQGPTITTNGTAVTSSGCRQTGQATAQGLVTTLPTISVNGTVFKSFAVANQAVHVERFDFDRWLEPNTALLITIAQSANGTPGSVDIEWSEQA